MAIAFAVHVCLLALFNRALHRGHRSGCVLLLVAVTRDLIALLEEQMFNMLLFY